MEIAKNWESRMQGNYIKIYICSSQLVSNLVFSLKKTYFDTSPSSMSFLSWFSNSWWISPTISSNWLLTNVMGSILGYWCSTGLSLVIGCWPLRPVEVEDSLISCLSKLKSCLRIILFLLSASNKKWFLCQFLPGVSVRKCLPILTTYATLAD